MIARLRRRRPPVPPAGEEALLARVRRLDASAWRLLYDQAYPVMSTYAMLRLGSVDQVRDVIRDAMLAAVRVLPSSERRGSTLRITLLGFVVDRIAAISRLEGVPDPAAVAALPAEGRQLRSAFFALPACEQDLLALLVAGATLEQAAATIRWDVPAAAGAVATACGLLAPRLSQAQVLEMVRAAFPGRPWEPRLEDQHALRAAVESARNSRRRRRVLGYGVLAAGAVMFMAGLLSGDVLPRPLRMLAYSAGLPVTSPRVRDVERDIALLSDALRRGDAVSVDLAARTLASAFDGLGSGEVARVQSDVDAELLAARQFLNGARAATGRPYPGPVTEPLVQASSPRAPAPRSSRPPSSGGRVTSTSRVVRRAVPSAPSSPPPAPAPVPPPPTPAPEPSLPSPGTPSPSPTPAPRPSPSPTATATPSPTPTPTPSTTPRPRPRPTRPRR